MAISINKELKLFVSESDRLLSKSFYKEFESNDICISNEQSLDTSPTEDQSEADVLHLRKFFQKSERVSFEKINKYLRNILNPKDPLMLEWNTYYTCLRKMMKSSSLTGRVNIEGLQSSPELDLEKIFKTKIYGDLFHLDGGLCINAIFFG
jgi:hypothetical protein